MVQHPSVLKQTQGLCFLRLRDIQILCYAKTEALHWTPLLGKDLLMLCDPTTLAFFTV